MAEKITHDMTQGKPGKVILTFTIPMVLGNVFQQFYNIVDSVVVGRFEGAEALAAVGTSFPIVYLLLTIAIGLTTGISILLSQYYGAKRYGDVRRTIYTGMIFLGGIACVLGAVGVAISSPALTLLGTPDNIYHHAESYLKIYFLGIPSLFLYNGSAAVLRATGDSKTPLYFLIFSTLMNICLDLLFVVKFGMGVSGVAWATLISQFTSGTLCILYIILRVKILWMKPEDRHFDTTLLRSILKLGIPSMMQQALVALGVMAMQSLVNSFGSDIIAGYTACTKIDSIANMPLMNVGNAVSTFTAQNLGAKRVDRVEEGYKITSKVAFLLSLTISGFIFLFGGNMMHWFIDYTASQGVIDFGVSYLENVSMFYWIGSIFMICNGVLRGSGDMKFYMFISFVNFGTRIATTYLLIPTLGAAAISWGIPAGWVVCGIVSYGRYRSGKWKNIHIA